MGNEARKGRGGALAAADAEIMVDYGHVIDASSNLALHGGALGLISSSSVVLIDDSKCTAPCSSAKRGDGNCDIECLNRACNWVLLYIFGEYSWSPPQPFRP